MLFRSRVSSAAWDAARTATAGAPMGNAAAFATLGRHVAALNALANGEEFITRVAAEAADEIEEAFLRRLSLP